jgi:hypothetical protein
MKRILGLSFAMFIALVAIALVGGDSGAVAGHGCKGRARSCQGGGLFAHKKKDCKGGLFGHKKNKGCKGEAAAAPACESGCGEAAPACESGCGEAASACGSCGEAAVEGGCTSCGGGEVVSGGCVGGGCEGSGVISEGVPTEAAPVAPAAPAAPVGT